jgi:hypothetical protein
VSGLLRAEWIRLRERRAIRVAVFGLPLLAAFLFVTDYQGAGTPAPVFDEQAYRQEQIRAGALDAVPPAQQARVLDQMVEEERATVGREQRQLELNRGRYAFPQSLLTVLGGASLVFFAVIALGALTLGDEFSNGTIRTALIAASDRVRLLAARLVALGSVALLLIGSIVGVGLLLPALLVISAAGPTAASRVDTAALLVLVAGDLLVCIEVLGFATLATLAFRSGGLTLLVALLYLAVESATVQLLSRSPAFGPGGPLARLPELLPARAVLVMSDEVSRAAGAIAHVPDEPVVRDLASSYLAFAAIFVWATIFLALAFWRFMRMDIVE